MIICKIDILNVQFGKSNSPTRQHYRLSTCETLKMKFLISINKTQFVTRKIISFNL